ncbi:MULTISPECIES: ATP-binding protein [unclassified Sedimentibacter]|uniref:ATP-binding protein n=1 Tax=unclassified Sedimentibacter TaxID=2649220 RepID=UPI0027E07302|nr:ATP-binding protein [Sedimentibacter sp. MB35-C1]WMJ77558.1 ATP-binding protein [Sedimentibacter sp. MB35-C1]
MYNQNFDPLSIKYTGTEEVVIKSLKREIKNILSSYVGWFDTFCELIQNALDSVEERQKCAEKNYIPKINILINIMDNYVAVTDNGMGFSEEQYVKFLAPNFSFKSGQTRGHKGVGSTYLAYGFNYIQISTKNNDFNARGVMSNARNWLDDENPAGNPRVVPDTKDTKDDFYKTIDQGVSVCVKYDTNTYPKDLSWIKVDDADNWLKLLRVKTGLGAIIENPKIHTSVKVISKQGKETLSEMEGIRYLSIDEFVKKSLKYTDIKVKFDKLYKEYGAEYRIPSKYCNLDSIYDMWNYNRILEEISLDDNQKILINKYKPTVYFCYVYSVQIWNKINSVLKLRSGVNALYGGIQLAANNMPQGELIQIPLTRNIGRQNQAHIVVHFENCSADLGRKGFQKEITDLAKEVARKILDGPLLKMKKCFRKNTGTAPDLMREQKLDEWKTIMLEHEKECPLELINENFFIPLKQISITSIPTREQDVIALFNQLIAGGVIRGIRIMSTNERFTYDGLYKIVIEEPTENHIYNKITNPLGVSEENVVDILDKSPHGFSSYPKVLEYKYSLDGLIEDLESGLKNSNDIGLIIAWNAGQLYKKSFYIESLLSEDNIQLRQYHGVTHRLLDISNNEIVADMILLEDLILYLNNPNECALQQEKYDE